MDICTALQLGIDRMEQLNIKHGVKRIYTLQDNQITHVCALGSIALGTWDNILIALDRDPMSIKELKETYPVLETLFCCPYRDCEQGYEFALVYVIVHLNDVHVWSLTQIKEWIEKQIS